MNAFSEIRHRLYVQRSGNLDIDHRNSVRELGNALFGGSPDLSTQRTLEAASLRYTSDKQEVFSLIEHAGESRYFDLYLSDAIGSRPQWREDAADLLRSKNGNPRFSGLEKLIKAQEAENGNEYSHQLAHPVSIIQCMFYGDPTRSGRGSSGGIGTLLTQLGNAIPPTAGGIATLVLYDRGRSSYPFVPVENLTDCHSIVRLSVELEQEAPGGFPEARSHIGNSVGRTFGHPAMSPDIVHVRFLDDASLAAARSAKSAGAKLVATITPDPHRQIIDQKGNIKKLPSETAIDYINKILIGDELVAKADGILAIGTKTLERELWPYYPQLEDTRGKVIAGIDEGVQSHISPSEIDIPSLLTSPSLEFALTAEHQDRRTVLSVGRLAGIKNQVALVKAWSADAWKTHNLVLIGGDFANPNREEQEIIEGIRSCVAPRPELSGRFCHLPGRSNRDIRTIQAYFSQRRTDHGDLYICPSIKEEFGLSILEAMSVGLVVLAPLKGGAGSYIRHGVNGFLIATESSESLEREMGRLLVCDRLTDKKARAIGKNAARTVETRYSMKRIAADFADFYRRVNHG